MTPSSTETRFCSRPAAVTIAGLRLTRATFSHVHVMVRPVFGLFFGDLSGVGDVPVLRLPGVPLPRLHPGFRAEHVPHAPLDLIEVDYMAIRCPSTRANPYLGSVGGF